MTPGTREAPAPRGRRLLLWAPVALLLALEFFLSSRSHLPDPVPVRIPQSDKLLHGGYFFLTGLVAYRAARRAEGWPRRKAALAVVCGALVWGVSDEWHQSFVPERSVEAADVAADVGGAALATLWGESALRRLERRS